MRHQAKSLAKWRDHQSAAATSLGPGDSGMPESTIEAVDVSYSEIRRRLLIEREVWGNEQNRQKTSEGGREGAWRFSYMDLRICTLHT